MAATPQTYSTSNPPRPDLRGRERVDYEPNALSEYTQRHREAWPVLLRSPDAETLIAPEMTSWLRLWGRVGHELYQCFRMGDNHIRTDMISLARHKGGWRGAIIANKLLRWQSDLPN